MGNSLGGRRKAAKVMKVDGTVLKLKPPVTAREALKGHLGHVLLDAKDVKRLGVRSPPLEPEQLLHPKRLYFLVELPKAPNQTSSIRGGQRVQSAVNMTAKDRLEALMLKRRAESDITSLIRVPTNEGTSETGGGLRMKVRLPKSEVARLMQESGNSIEATEKILKLVKKKEVAAGGRAPHGGGTMQSGESTSSGELLSSKEKKKMRFASQEPDIIE